MSRMLRGVVACVLVLAGVLPGQASGGGQPKDAWHAAATEALRRSVRIAEKVGSVQAARLTADAALLALVLGEPGQAEQWLRQAWQTARHLPDNDGHSSRAYAMRAVARATQFPSWAGNQCL